MVDENRQTETAGSARWRIMVVDDDLPLLYTILDMLSVRFETVGAVNGLDALEKLDRYEPDLLVLDVAMPCVDGIDTCRAIRKNVRFAKVPIVFLSGKDETDYADRVDGLGAVRFLSKPVTPQRLLDCCSEAIGQTGLATPPRKRFSTTELGALEAASTADRSVSTVEPTLAAEPEQLDIETKPTGPSKPYGGVASARVMIIDDESDVVAFMLAVLRDQFEVFGVRDPVSAIHKIIRYQPDLIILDIAMPRLSGYQLSQLLRLNRTLREIKVLFASSKDAPQEIDYARKLGAAGYLCKPFGAETLLKTVTGIVDAPDFLVREKAMTLEEIRRAEKDDDSPSQFP